MMLTMRTGTFASRHLERDLIDLSHPSIQLGIYAVFITVPVVIIAVNIAALRLAKVIDAQVKYNLQVRSAPSAFLLQS